MCFKYEGPTELFLKAVIRQSSFCVKLSFGFQTKSWLSDTEHVASLREGEAISSSSM